MCVQELLCKPVPLTSQKEASESLVCARQQITFPLLGLLQMNLFWGPVGSIVSQESRAAPSVVLEEISFKPSIAVTKPTNRSH